MKNFNNVKVGHCRQNTSGQQNSEEFSALQSAKTLLVITSMLFAITSCKKESTLVDTEGSGKREIADGLIKPQEFPSNLKIEGFNFPEDSTTIYNWLNKQDTVSITKHAWGIWAGLTAKTNQMYQGDSLYVFETWLGVKELAAFAAAGNKEGGCTPSKKGRTNLSVPRQFIHSQIIAGSAIDTASFEVYETVSYSPSAACFATQNLIFNQSVLDKYKVNNGIGRIPAFPNTAITTKPTYFAAKPDSNGLIAVPVWPGIPNPPQAYKYTKWNTYVYADVNNRQPANKKLIPVIGDNPTPDQIKKATCNITDFINYKLDQAGAAYLNLHQDKGNSQFVAGDYVLLVGMHVGTKEISNWTWQTYFWSYDRSSPFAPSSKFNAGLRPSQIKGAAANYAVSPAYAMVWPNQPVNKGTNKNVKPVIAFNPYLEGEFGPGTFNIPNDLNKDYKYGVQTNCMSCHALATAGNVGYTTAQYISMDNMKLFSNQVQLDFAWSIQGNINTKK